MQKKKKKKGFSRIFKSGVSAYIVVLVLFSYFIFMLCSYFNAILQVMFLVSTVMFMIGVPINILKCLLKLWLMFAHPELLSTWIQE